MKTFTQFHGTTFIQDIGKELRSIVRNEKNSFKIMTGYGSSTGTSKSKTAALRSLAKMQSEGLIKGYFPGEVKNMLLSSDNPFHEAKMTYGQTVKNDPDYGNDGIIFIFI
ncbi:MAG: hypothetical protein JXB20_06630 [Bacilli bacterium]|nr:hypothetical protein [Bacilli bacterium]MBN2697082.1 hypothetical protein [Bacilli bacterium]